MIDRERVIKRLMRCVVPDRYSHYPKSFYERLTDDQLVSMCYEIKVDGPDFDIVDDENEGGSMGEYRNIADRDDSWRFEALHLRINPDTNEKEVLTESGWETFYD